MAWGIFSCVLLTFKKTAVKLFAVPFPSISSYPSKSFMVSECSPRAKDLALSLEGGGGEVRGDGLP